jgi:hypothetical protein
LRTIVVQVADALQNDAEHFGFSNIPHPGVTQMSHFQNATEWPSAAAIHTALTACHEAVGELKAAWANVPASERAHLQLPRDPWSPSQSGSSVAARYGV